MDTAPLHAATPRGHYRSLDPAERFIREVGPTLDECAMMLSDLIRCLDGGWPAVERATGIPERTMNSWFNGKRSPSAASAKAVFIFWAMICRPGEIETVFDLATCGRFTRRGNPATAGGKLKRNLKRHHKPKPEPEAGNGS